MNREEFFKYVSELDNNDFNRFNNEFDVLIEKWNKAQNPVYMSVLINDIRKLMFSFDNKYNYLLNGYFLYNKKKLIDFKKLDFSNTLDYMNEYKKIILFIKNIDENQINEIYDKLF